MFEIKNESDYETPQSKKGLPLKIKKIILFVVLILLSIGIVTVVVIRNQSKNYNNLKEYKNNFIVFSKYNDVRATYNKEIPYVNMKADVIKKVNEDIDSFCKNYKDAETARISYEYDINGIILSIAVKIVNNNTVYAPEVYIKTYNINLSTQEVIADDALLNFFNTTEQQTALAIEKKLEKFRLDEIKKNYFSDEECDFECFKSNRGIINYLDDIHYYVKDAHLIVFKPFTYYSMFGEENYFKDSDFEFIVAEAPQTD